MFSPNKHNFHLHLNLINIMRLNINYVEYSLFFFFFFLHFTYKDALLLHISYKYIYKYVISNLRTYSKSNAILLCIFFCDNF